MARLDATDSIILLAAVWYGSHYGAALAAIFLKTPADAALVGTDGSQMARQGRGRAALASAWLGACVAGGIGALVVALLALPLAEVAFRFGPAEYFSLTVLALVAAVAFSPGPFVKGVSMLLLGLLLAQMGTDAASSSVRFAFGLRELADGIGIVALAVGVLAIGEVIARIGAAAVGRDVVAGALHGERPRVDDLREAWPSMLRGSALGVVFGLLPGRGASFASFAAYAVERRVAVDPRVPFGRGAIEGVAGPHAAGNAAAQTSFVPALAFGLPPNAAMVVLLAALTLKGVHVGPGPQVMTSQPSLFWGLVASLWIGNVLLVVVNLPLAGLWVRLLGLPRRALVPAIVMLAALGAYAMQARAVDVEMLAFFGLLGYVFFKLGCEPAPLLLGFVLEPMLEENLRQALRLSAGDWKTFVTRPLSSGLLVAAAILVVVVAIPAIRRRRRSAFHED